MNALLFHPKVVHIPIALGVLMPLIVGGLALAWWRGWLPWRAWILAVGLQAVLLGSSVVALRSGEAEEERVEHVVPERVLEAHEEAAEAFAWASGAVLAVMLLAAIVGTRRSGLPAAVATLGTLVVLGLGYRAGQSGGGLVYQHGAARAYGDAVGGGSSDDRAAPPARRDDD